MTEQFGKSSSEEKVEKRNKGEARYNPGFCDKWPSQYYLHEQKG